ncbi:MAG: hypothetical protein ACYS32_00610 [Planctomycetota bacterium]|jgi:hypothetical protein
MGIGVLGTMTPNLVEKTQGFMKNAIQAHSARSDKYKHEPEKNTVGGGIMAGMGGAASGFAMGGTPGAVIGGVLGLAGYGLS